MSPPNTKAGAGTPANDKLSQATATDLTSGGGRVPYKVAGAAMRRATERAEALTDTGDELTAADWLVLLRVLVWTASYSKLIDEKLAFEDLRPPGVSIRQARRSLAKLTRLEIIVYTAARGRGKSTSVALPAAQESGQIDGPLPTKESGQVDGPLPERKAAKGVPEKRPPTRARLQTEKYLEESMHACDEDFTKLVAPFKLQSSGTETALAWWKKNPAHVKACATKTKAKAGVENPAGFFLHCLAADPEPAEKLSQLEVAMRWARAGAQELSDEQRREADILVGLTDEQREQVLAEAKRRGR
jgi:hypothetical protein